MLVKSFMHFEKLKLFELGLETYGINAQSVKP